MTNSELAREFSNLYDRLFTYSSRAIGALRLKIEPEEVLSEAYLHVNGYVDEILTTGQLESYAKNFIKCNLNWWNSPLRRQTRGRNHSELHNGHTAFSEDLPDAETIAEWTAEYIKSLTNQQRRLFHIYTTIGKRKGLEVAAHLDISISGAYTYIREAKVLEAGYREHIKKKII